MADSNFDPRTLALLNRIANNRRSNLQVEAQQPAARCGGAAATSAARNKLHALLGGADGGGVRRPGVADTPHRPGTAAMHHEGRGGPAPAASSASRPASAAMGARSVATRAASVGASLRGAPTAAMDDAIQPTVCSGVAGGSSLSSGAAAAGGREQQQQHVQQRRDDGVIFTESPYAPGQTVVYRAPAEKLADPERLNLDRRGLAACPVLEGEERLRLLNYQNNQIAQICNLHSLPNLIFLDLYNNQIARITGLDPVPTLRVLMLGKNRLTKVENLEALPKLDVLDLHCNQISEMEGLSHLAELRVLNLAGNQISRLDTTKLRGMGALIELNLRRNLIASIDGLQALPALQRLFLSNNMIAAFGALGALVHMSCLHELALDGNPISQESSFRVGVCELSRSLRQLDLKRVTEEERRASAQALKREGERAQAQARRSQLAEARHEAMRAVQQAWHDRPRLKSNLPTAASGLWPGADETAAAAADAIAVLGARAAGAPAASATRGEPPDELARRGFVEVEEEEGGLRLCCYGDPGDALERIEATADATGVSFHFVHFDRILLHQLPRLREMPRLRHLSLCHNDLHSLAQLGALATLPRLASLQVSGDGNTVVLLPHFRAFIVSLIPTLTSINHAPVTVDERRAAEEAWRGHQRLYRLARSSLAARLAPLAGQLAMGLREQAPPSTGRALAPAEPVPGLARRYVGRVLGHSLAINEKISQLNELWPELVQKYEGRVREELDDPELFRQRYEALAWG